MTEVNISEVVREPTRAFYERALQAKELLYSHGEIARFRRGRAGRSSGPTFPSLQNNYDPDPEFRSSYSMRSFGALK
jgi:hypothetical protein